MIRFLPACLVVGGIWFAYSAAGSVLDTDIKGAAVATSHRYLVTGISAAACHLVTHGDQEDHPLSFSGDCASLPLGLEMASSWRFEEFGDIALLDGSGQMIARFAADELGGYVSVQPRQLLLTLSLAD